MFVKLRRFARVLAFTISMYLVTHLIVFFFLFPIGTPLIIFDSGNGPRIKKGMTKALFKVIGQRLKVHGLDNLEPEKNYIIVSNYPGSYAGFALMNVFPDALMVVHSFFLKVPIVGFLLKSTGATFVQSRKSIRIKQSIDDTLQKKEHKNIVIFPEGGRSPDGRIHSFKRGYIYLLRHSSMDLLPVTLNGFYSLKPMKRVSVDPDVDLEVVLHRPLDRSVIDNLDDEALMKLTVDTIQREYKP